MSKPAHVWTTFSKVCNGKELKFRIQESDKYEDILDLFVNYYVPEEPVHKSANLTKTEQTLKQYKATYIEKAINESCQIDVCCLEDDSGELKIVAGSIMYLEKKGDPDWDGEEMANMVLTEQVAKFFKMVIHMSNLYVKDFREKYNTFYDDVGIVVHPDYRGLGIAGELLKARVLICKEHGVPTTSAWMTSFGSQKAATKLGWTTVLELNYKDLEKIGGVIFEGAPPSAQLMIIKV